MAIVKYPVGSVGLNKSVGSSCFSANFNSSYIRLRKKGITSKSPRATFARTNFLHLVRFWSSLSAPKKLQWANAAASLPKVNSLGVVYYISGFQLFCSRNQTRLYQGFSISDSPAFPPPPGIKNISAPSFTLSPFNLSTSFALSPVPNNVEYRIWATRVLSEGLAMKYPFDFKLISTLLPGTTSPINLTADYISIFGDGPLDLLVGKKPWAIFLAMDVYSIQFNGASFANQLEVFVS